MNQELQTQMQKGDKWKVGAGTGNLARTWVNSQHAGMKIGKPKPNWN